MGPAALEREMGARGMAPRGCVWTGVSPDRDAKEDPPYQQEPGVGESVKVGSRERSPATSESETAGYPTMP